MAGCPNAVLGLPFLRVAGGGAWAAQMQSPWGGCLKAVLQHRQRCSGHNTVRGPPLQTRVVAAYGAVSQLANMLIWGMVILAHMEGTNGKANRSKLNGGKNVRWAVGMAKAECRQANKKARRTGHCRHTQPADSPPSGHTQPADPRTGLKQQQPAGGRPRSKTTAATKLACLSPCSAGRWGECKGVALRKAGADLPNLSLPHLSPLPVTVPTHSLNL